MNSSDDIPIAPDPGGTKAHRGPFGFTSILICLALATSHALDAQVIDGLRIRDSGALETSGIKIAVQVFDGDWDPASQNDTTTKASTGFPRKSSQAWKLQGHFTHPKAGVFRFSQKLTRHTDNQAEVHWALERDNAVNLNAIAVTIDLPLDTFKGKTVLVDNEPILLPETYEKGRILLLTKDCKTISIPLTTGKLVFTGNLNALVQDNREWGEGPFSARLSFTPDSGPVTRAECSLKMAIACLDSRPLDLRTAANMGLADEIAGDQKGGWTDQGAENDLRSLKPGTLILGGIKFVVTDPAANNGKSVLVFHGRDRDYFLKEAEISGDDKSAAWLYMLHASAWTAPYGERIGTIRLQYTDGTSADRPVVIGAEVGNWWSPTDLKNGWVAWTAANTSAFVGLQLSRFPVDKPVRKVEFLPTGKSVWMVVAATLSTETLDFSMVNSPLYVGAGPHWAPITHVRATEKGSILDLSFLQRETGIPAGILGPVVVKNGHFEFSGRAGKRVRFNGGNVCFTANYLEKTEAEAFAEYVASLGHNALRIHHYESGLMDPEGPPGAQQIRPDQLDKLDYLIYCLKQRGIYITTDLFVSRPTRLGDLPGITAPVGMSDYKALALLGPARKDFEKWARWLLTEHVNPYTTFPLGKDPVLVALSLINEDNLDACWQSSDTTKRITLEKFAAWLSKEGIPEGRGAERNGHFTRFLVETQLDAFKEMSAFVKGLGVRTPLTDANMIDSPRWIWLRKDLDYVDSHGYWDHPSFPEGDWRLPFGFQNRQPLKSLGSLPGVQGGTRIFGKPFTVTEYQYVYPNPYRAEGSAIAAAYACLQDWDGLYRFALSHSRDNLVGETALAGFDIVADPIHVLGERMVSLSFLRGDVRPAANAYPFVIDKDYYLKSDGMSAEVWAAQFPASYWQLGWVSRIGSAWSEYAPRIPEIKAAVTPQTHSTPTLPNTRTFHVGDNLGEELEAAGALAAGVWSLTNKHVKSETGEIELDGNAATLRVASPRFEALVLADKGSLTAARLSAKSLEGYGALYLASIDGVDIARSRRLLFLHLTDVLSQNLKYRSRQKSLVETWGTPQRLVAAGRMAVSIKVDKPGELKCWGCDLAGKQIEEIPLQVNGEAISFTAETVKDGKARFMVYELGRP
jgi:hypothetical protein